MGDAAFHPPLRAAVAGLVGVGVALAASAAVLAYARVGVREGVTYTVIAVLLTAAAIGIARGVRWLVAVALVTCAGQVAAVVGTVLELVYGVAGVKAAQLRALGIDPRLGVAVNLAYSATGVVLAGWFAVRWRRASRSAEGSRRR